jgi:hypothetical protein
VIPHLLKHPGDVPEAERLVSRSLKPLQRIELALHDFGSLHGVALGMIQRAEAMLRTPLRR